MQNLSSGLTVSRIRMNLFCRIKPFLEALIVINDNVRWLMLSEQDQLVLTASSIFHQTSLYSENQTRISSFLYFVTISTCDA